MVRSGADRRGAGGRQTQKWQQKSGALLRAVWCPAAAGRSGASARFTKEKAAPHDLLPPAGGRAPERRVGTDDGDVVAAVGNQNAALQPRKAEPPPEPPAPKKQRPEQQREDPKSEELPLRPRLCAEALQRRNAELADELARTRARAAEAEQRHCAAERADKKEIRRLQQRVQEMEQEASGHAAAVAAALKDKVELRSVSWGAEKDKAALRGLEREVEHLAQQKCRIMEEVDSLRTDRDEALREKRQTEATHRELRAKVAGLRGAAREMEAKAMEGRFQSAVTCMLKAGGDDWVHVDGCDL